MDVRITAAALLALLLPAQAMAQRVYKCVEKEGTVYQSTPCASGPEQKSWSAQVAPRSLESRSAERRVEAMRRDNERRAFRERLAGPTRTVIQSPQEPDRDQCTAAKRQRAAAFDAMGTRRSWDATRPWDERVNRACGY